MYTYVIEIDYNLIILLSLINAPKCKDKSSECSDFYGGNISVPVSENVVQ
jgi:hypothetical protein